MSVLQRCPSYRGFPVFGLVMIVNNQVRLKTRENPFRGEAKMTVNYYTVDKGRKCAFTIIFLLFFLA